MWSHRIDFGGLYCEEPLRYHSHTGLRNCTGMDTPAPFLRHSGVHSAARTPLGPRSAHELAMKGVEKPSLRGLLEALEKARHCFDCGHPFWGRRLPQPSRWLGWCSERHARHAVQGGNPVRHPSGLPPGAVQDHDRLREKRGAFGDDRVPPGLDPVAVKLRREQEPGVTPERGVVERSTPRAVVKNPAARDGCRRQPGRVRRFMGFTDMANDEKLETRRDDRHLGTQTEPPQPATLTHCAIAACCPQTIYGTNTSPPADFNLTPRQIARPRDDGGVWNA